MNTRFNLPDPINLPDRTTDIDLIVEDSASSTLVLKRFQLTVSGCVGPCDVPKVVVVNSEAGSQWLGKITHFDQYRSLIEWAVRSVDAGHLLELPREFKDHLIEPWR